MPTTDSATVSGLISFSGTVIHDPTNPVGTLLRLPYGGVGKQRDIDIDKTALRYVGRTLPVYDVSTQETQGLSFSPTLVYEMENYSELKSKMEILARATTARLLRDKRGRKMYCVILKWSEEDIELGVSYDLEFDAVDYVEAV